ncbi:MAG: hypothetical protein PVI79_08390 [Gammaproteobacteria bacterium]|jgi:hypothetical protein
MAQSQFVPKAQLFNQLKQIISTRDTGLLTILTESNRSIFLRFSRGKLTRLYCRSGEAGEAIQMLAEGSLVKFTYANAPEDEEPEFMPTDSFMQLIDPGGDGGISTPSSSITPAVGRRGGDPIRAQMLEIAIEYVGVVAEMIVDEAFENGNDVARAIDYIAGAIPDRDQASAFREAAREHFSAIDI